MAAAGFSIDVKGDVKRITRDLKRVQRKIVPKAAAKALNRTNRGIKTDATKALSSELNIKPQKRVRRRLLLPRGLRATPKRLVTGGLRLFRFVPAVWLVGKGKRALKSSTGPNRFIAEMESGHVGLFSRKPGSKHRKVGGVWQPELKITQIIENVERRAVEIHNRVVAKAGRVRWPREFQAAIDFRKR